jgi:hypothetical protein
MKKLLIFAGALSIAVVIMASGCGNVPTPPGEETSSCVICHSDKELLQQTATVIEEETTGETTGEG